jgi:hypothetical protein
MWNSGGLCEQQGIYTAVLLFYLFYWNKSHKFTAFQDSDNANATSTPKMSRTHACSAYWTACNDCRGTGTNVLQYGSSVFSLALENPTMAGISQRCRLMPEVGQTSRALGETAVREWWNTLKYANPCLGPGIAPALFLFGGNPRSHQNLCEKHSSTRHLISAEILKVCLSFW